ncbi:MAG: hypothetical protein NT120_02280 [Candidatus Aenigmarchaeota archaeon]|nr:hypothetical protein [Candidatus Aenigmarchaeota archaeon]
MEIVTKLPDQKHVLGTRQIVKGINEGKIKRVIAANNCPASLLAKIKDVKVDRFDGDESQLATKLGKPFPIAMVGY